MHIIIVCTANVCRSPVGEALLREKLQAEGLGDWRVTSAGTWAQMERGASQFSVEVVRERYGLDLGHHQAKMIDEAMMVEADLLLCMESGHAEALRAEFPAQAHKVYMLSQMISPRTRFNVDDPYGGSKFGYEQMVTQVDELITDGLPRIIRLARQNAGLN